MADYEVKTVLIGVNRLGQGGIYKGDLIFEDSRPILVVEWSGERGISPPSTTVQLDPRFLQAAPTGFEADYMYQHPIEDPRKFQ